jgi:crotonobetaine/carnitine-CoA ligase
MTLYEAFDSARQRAGGLPFLAESVISGGREWTFEQAGTEIDRLVLLYGERGWGVGHRIALAVGNHPRHFFHFIALNCLGVSIVPLNPDHRGAEIRHALRLAEVDAIVAKHDRHQAIAQAIATDDALKQRPNIALEQLELMLTAAPRPALEALNPLSPLSREAAILFTSGTSGQPKACILTNEYVLTAGAWYRDLGGLLTLRHASERVFNPLPVFHMNCGMTSIATMCLTDNCLVLPDRFHVSTWWEDCVKSRATGIHYLGIMPPALIKQELGPWEASHQIRFGLGAGCDPTLHPAFEKRFGFPLVEVWGMTETGRFLTNQHEPRMTHTRAFGRAAAPLRVRVVDDHDQNVSIDTPGELLVCAEADDPRQGFFSGYLNDQDATQTAWRGGWFHTGDVVTQDSSGMLYFVDRRKDMIRRSGENISAGEVETALAAHPAVARVVVMAVADEMRDEEVLAVVVPAAGYAANALTAQELVRFCLGELSYYKAPAWVAFFEQLPSTATNKVQKNRIFAPGADPRLQAFDCRTLKIRPRADHQPNSVATSPT